MLLNPVVEPGQDPWIVHHDGAYHLVQSTPDARALTIRRSATLAGLGAADAVVIWRGYGDRCCELWAPELFRFGDRWYIYVAADDGDNHNHRMYVLGSRGDDPFGPYTDLGRIAAVTDRWAIDGTVLRWPDGRLYFVWSGWAGRRNVAQNLYIAPMADPVTIVGDRSLICEPTLPWERHGGPPYVVEGPAALTRGDRIFLTYSASGSWTDRYCLGMLATDVGRDPTRQASWRKSARPVFAGIATAYGPGHNSFFTSPDGSELWLAYHANRRAGAGWGGRSVRAQPVRWGADGTPWFGKPAPVGAPLVPPSGEYHPPGDGGPSPDGHRAR
ncbi:MAG TPA: glycoside hydrolase family 43 protein [Micromonosporaceae bacterium]